MIGRGGLALKSNQCEHACHFLSQSGEKSKPTVNGVLCFSRACRRLASFITSSDWIAEIFRRVAVDQMR